MNIFGVLLLIFSLLLAGCATTCDSINSQDINDHSQDIKVDTSSNNFFYEQNELKVFSGIESEHLDGSILRLKLEDKALFEQYSVPVIQIMRETKYEAHPFTGTFTPVGIFVWIINPTKMNTYTFGCNVRKLLSSELDFTKKLKTGRSEWRNIQRNHKILVSGFNKDYEFIVENKGGSSKVDIDLHSAIINTGLAKSTTIKVTCIDCEIRDLDKQNITKDIKTSIEITQDFRPEKILLLATDSKAAQPTNQNSVLPPPSSNPAQQTNVQPTNPVIDEAKATCEQLGFKKGSEKFGKCVLQITK